MAETEERVLRRLAETRRAVYEAIETAGDPSGVPVRHISDAERSAIAEFEAAVRAAELYRVQSRQEMHE